MKKILLILLLLTSSVSALARNFCNVPENLDIPKVQDVDNKKEGPIDSYVLAISWSPQFCSTSAGKSDESKFQCKLNKFGFVVHGLWGQNDNAKDDLKDHPRHCNPSKSGDAIVVDSKIIEQNICTMPSTKLIQGEWQKHGTCTSMSQVNYFGKINELYNSLYMPDMANIVNEKNETTVLSIVSQILLLNREKNIPSDSIVIRTGKNNVLNEIFICYDTNFNFKACKSKGAPLMNKIVIKPR